MLAASCQPYTPPQRPGPFPQDPRFGQLPENTEIAIAPDTIPKTPPPSLYAASAFVIDVKTKRVLCAKNADTKRAVASTQKLITALCVVDAGDLDKKVVIQPSDANCEPTKLGLRPGEVYTRRQLLQVLLVKSANDVGRALARDVGGSQRGFANLMNKKCKELGMRNSHFKNPHGLTEPGQYSTARDIAIAGLAAYNEPTIRRYTNMKEFTFRFNNGRTIRLENTNKILDELHYCNGMKTGTTRASGRCLVASGSLDGRSVISVVLKSNTPNIWKDSEKLLRWALER